MGNDTVFQVVAASGVIVAALAFVRWRRRHGSG
jgi:hypothetical protein